MKKYELLKELTKTTTDGHILYRIRALVNLEYKSRVRIVSAGRLGGWVESEKNLSHEGLCWIDGENAMVYDEAVVYEDAQIEGNAIIKDHANIYGSSKVTGNAKVGGYANICDCALIKDNAIINDTALIEDSAAVFDNAVVEGSAIVSGPIQIGGTAHILGEDNSAPVCIKTTGQWHQLQYTLEKLQKEWNKE